MSPTPQITIPAYLLELGTTVYLRAHGELSTGTTADTLTIGFYWGGIAAAKPLASGAALAVATGGTSDVAWPWEMEYYGEIRALGSVGSIKGMGTFKGPALTTGLVSPMLVYPIPQTAAARTVSIDTTTSTIITAAAGWSATTGAPTITCYDLVVKLIG